MTERAEKTKDRWDQILEKTVHHHHYHHTEDPFEKSDEFAFFDSNDVGDDRVFMDEEKLVVVSERNLYPKRDEDMLKQIFEKEFSPQTPEPEIRKTIQKPPRKSIENRRSYDSLNRKRHSGSYSSSHNSMIGFDD